MPSFRALPVPSIFSEYPQSQSIRCHFGGISVVLSSSLPIGVTYRSEPPISVLVLTATLSARVHLPVNNLVSR